MEESTGIMIYMCILFIITIGLMALFEKRMDEKPSEEMKK